MNAKRVLVGLMFALVVMAIVMATLPTPSGAQGASGKLFFPISLRNAHNPGWPPKGQAVDPTQAISRPVETATIDPTRGISRPVETMTLPPTETSTPMPTHTPTIKPSCTLAPTSPPTTSPEPTTPSCTWQFGHLGPPEGCRWFDSHGLPVRFNIEKRILMPDGKTTFVENSFYIMSGYAGYVVGEGDYTVYCPGDTEAMIRQDMVDHMARRRLDPQFIADNKTIGEVSVSDARAWGILRDNCDGVDICPNPLGDFQHLPLESSPHDVNADADKIGILKLWTNRPGRTQTLYRATFKVDQPIRVLSRNGGDVTYWLPTCQTELENNWTGDHLKSIPVVDISWFVANGYVEWLPLP